MIIRRGSEEVAGYVIVWSLREYRIPVCSPKLLARIPIDRLQDLEKHTLLHSTSRPTLWSDWLKAAWVVDLKPRRSLVFEHNYQTLQAAIDGLGVATAASALIDDDIIAGRLALPFLGPKLPAEGYCAYVPKAKSTNQTIMKFCKWLQRVSPAEGTSSE